MSKPQITTFKKILVILCILSGIEILVLTLAGIYNLVYVIPKQNTNKNTFSISTENIQSQNPKTQLLKLATLDILPSDYDTITTSFGSFTGHELTTYLNYSEVTKTKDTSNITNGYKYLEDTKLNILIPQPYIDTYVLSQIDQISTLIQASSTPTLKSYIQTQDSTSVFQNATKCIANNLEAFLEDQDCQDYTQLISNETLSPTLRFLYESVKLTPLSSTSTYDKYIQTNLYLYQISQNENDSTQNIDTSKYSNDVYLDLDTNHIYKLQLMLNYLKETSKQLDLENNTEITKRITALESILNELNTYKYGNILSDSLRSVVNNSLINMSSQEKNILNLDNHVEFLIKSFTIGNETKTFVAPIYILNNTSTPIQALTFEINDNNFNQAYDITPTAQSRGTVRVPIFMYHQITNPPTEQSSFKTGLYVSPSDFEKEMAYLVKKNYKSITTKEYYDLLMTGKNPAQKTVMITFDDGVENQYTNAYPILKKYGLTGVFYVIAQRSSMTGAQMKEMANNGMIIDSHSSSHRDLTNMYDPDTLSYEIASSKYALQATTSKTVTSFAYPGCGWNHTVVSYVASAGYLLGMSCGSSIDNYPGYRYELSRVHAFGDMERFVKALSGITK